MSLAIVIPVYKIEFLEEALKSIANQTCKDFTLYIGDDCSPHNIKKVVKKFEREVNIVFKRFDTNLGGQDLVAQWERCIDLIGQEEWIWLFSDDDIMAATCVEKFYEALEETSHSSYLYHFNIQTIGEQGEILKKLPRFPKKLTSLEFFEKRSSNELISFVVEFIFNKEVFLKKGRFQNFDLAWASDHATWIKLSENNLIYTIDDALVYWRKSALNISPNTHNIKMAIRKINASRAYYLWVWQFFDDIGKKVLIKSFLNNIKEYNQIVPWQDFKGNIIQFMNQIGSNYSNLALVYMYIHRLYKKVKAN
ncbi:MAG: glycosyltransferase [Bacteroidota bacterium]|nr:glycosyltransferase [Bacteroidota bacterium]